MVSSHNGLQLRLIAQVFWPTVQYDANCEQCSSQSKSFGDGLIAVHHWQLFFGSLACRRWVIICGCALCGQSGGFTTMGRVRWIVRQAIALAC